MIQTFHVMVELMCMFNSRLVSIVSSITLTSFLSVFFSQHWIDKKKYSKYNILSLYIFYDEFSPSSLKRTRKREIKKYYSFEFRLQLCVTQTNLTPLPMQINKYHEIITNQEIEKSKCWLNTFIGFFVQRQLKWWKRPLFFFWIITICGIDKIYSMGEQNRKFQF